MPYRNTPRWQIRQVSELVKTFAGAIKTRAAGYQKPLDPGIIGKNIDLLLRMAGAHHFNSGAAQYEKFIEQIIQDIFTQIIPCRMRDNSSAAAAANPVNHMTELSPIMMRITRLALNQVFLENRFHILGVAFFDQKPGEMRAADQAAFTHISKRTSKAASDANFFKLVRKRAGALRQSVANTR